MIFKFYFTFFFLFNLLTIFTNADDCSAPTEDSDSFTLKAESSTSSLNGATIYIDDGDIYLGKHDTSATAKVLVNSSLTLDGNAVLIGKNYLSVQSFSSDAEYADPFEIVGGYLKLYGGDFKAVNTGSDVFVLASANGLSGSVVKLAAYKLDGSSFTNDYVPLTAEGISDPSAYKASASVSKPQQPEVKIPSCSSSTSSSNAAATSTFSSNAAGTSTSSSNEAVTSTSSTTQSSAFESTKTTDGISISVTSSSSSSETGATSETDSSQTFDLASANSVSSTTFSTSATSNTEESIIVEKHSSYSSTSATGSSSFSSVIATNNHTFSTSAGSSFAEVSTYEDSATKFGVSFTILAAFLSLLI